MVNSVDTILALFPNQVITPISGEPTYVQMKRWEKEIRTNLIAIQTPDVWGRGKGHLGMIQDINVFVARNGAVYNPPNNAPPVYPIIPTHSTSQVRERLCGTHKVKLHHWERYHLTTLTIVTIGAAAFDNFVTAELDDPDEGLDRVLILDLYDHVMDRFASVMQDEIDANLALFNQPMDASRPLALYTRK